MAIAGLLLAMVQGCSDQESVPPERIIPEAHRDYIRLKAGMQLTYRLDSIIYDDFAETIDTTTYMVVDEVLEKLADSNGSRRFQLKRTVKPYQESRVLSSELYSARITPDEYQVFRNNVRKLKLSFPLEEKKRWDGNAYSSRDSQIYRVSTIHEAATVSGRRYDSTLMVIEEQDENLIELNAARTRYAKHVGQIFREQINLSYRGDSIPPEEIPWEEKANTGNIVRYRLEAIKEGS